MYQIDFNKPIHVHFIGIGGSNMSGLAELLHTRHFIVSGSDENKNDACAKLEGLGISVRYGQSAAGITPDMDLGLRKRSVLPEHMARQQLLPCFL